MSQREKQLRVFGYGLPLILLVLSIRHSNIFLIILAAMMLVITLTNRPLLELLFRYWMKAAGVIGYCVSTVLLCAVFFLLFTPMALIIRLLKKDFLLLSRNMRAESYWIMRPGKKMDIKEYTQQF